MHNLLIIFSDFRHCIGIISEEHQHLTVQLTVRLYCSGAKLLALMSLITIKYNHMGSVYFALFCGMLHSLGITKYVGFKEGEAVIKHGIHTVKHHGDIWKLEDHSEFVRFVLKVRTFFNMEFTKFKEDFPGIEKEAFFQGTVMHSLDHENYTKFLKSAEYSHLNGANCEMARIILNCFVEKPPSLIDTRFSMAPHPFYRNVYNYAKSINQRLADSLDCCVDV